MGQNFIFEKKTYRYMELGAATTFVVPRVVRIEKIRRGCGILELVHGRCHLDCVSGTEKWMWVLALERRRRKAREE